MDDFTACLDTHLDNFPLPVTSGTQHMTTSTYLRDWVGGNDLRSSRLDDDLDARLPCGSDLTPHVNHVGCGIVRQGIAFLRPRFVKDSDDFVPFDIENRMNWF